MLTARKVDHVVLRTGQLEPMIAFYSDIFGASVVRRDDRLGLVQLSMGDFLLDLLSVSGVASTESEKYRNSYILDHLCIEIDPVSENEVDALSARLGQDLAFRTLYGAKGYGPSTMISDPDGNRIELKMYPSD